MVRSRSLKFAPSVVLLIVPVMLALISQPGRVQPASAQTGAGTAVPTVMSTVTVPLSATIVSRGGHSWAMRPM